jgi:hypothetical protein
MRKTIKKLAQLRKDKLLAKKKLEKIGLGCWEG